MKHVKKLASLILAVVMVVALALPCYAANTVTILKDDPNATIPVVYAYQIFSGDISGGKLTNVTWGRSISADKEGLVDALIEEGFLSDDFKTFYGEEYWAQFVSEAVARLADDSAELDRFAEVVSDYLNASFVCNYGAESFDVNGDGYYLFKNTKSTTNPPEAYTKYILKVAESETYITMKSDAPSLDKEIVGGEESDATSASIGDKITFQLTSTIPEMDGYDKYYYIIHDTMSSGLTFNDDITVSMNGQNMVAYTDGQEYANSDYYVEFDAASNSFKIVFINFLQYKGQTGEITVTYSATLNQDAQIYPNANTNKAYLQYSNDPNYDHDGETSEKPGDDIPDNPPGDEPGGNPPPDPTGTTPESFVYIYSTTLRLNKLDEVGGYLSNAKFKIEGTSTGIYKINENVFRKDNANGTWYRLTNGSYTQTAPTAETADVYESTTDKYVSVTVNKETPLLSNLVNEGWVDDYGVLLFTGLGEGTYTITELVAPEGYNKLKHPITVDIKWNGTEAEDMWTVTITLEGLNGEPYTLTSGISSGVYPVYVSNTPGVQLPSTGGMGTTLFYFAGSLLVLAACILLVTKKRMANIA